MRNLIKRLFGRSGGWSRKLDVASVCSRGMVRSENQDSFLVADDRALFCVADGMGGGDGGAEASAIMCRRLDRTVKARTSFPERIRQAAEAIRGANGEIRDYAHKAGYRQMATTVVILALDEAPSATAIVASVGDSRMYRFRDGNFQQMTHDHTLAGELSRRASMRSLASEFGARTGALSHVLTRAVGIEEEVQPDWRKLDVRPGDVCMICSDGVYDMVPDEGIRAAIAAGGTAAEIAARIERLVLAEGAADNFTAIVVKIGGGE